MSLLAVMPMLARPTVRTNYEAAQGCACRAFRVQVATDRPDTEAFRVTIRAVTPRYTASQTMVVERKGDAPAIAYFYTRDEVSSVLVEELRLETLESAEITEDPQS